MIISCIGDSLTEGDYGVPGKYGIANVHAENYPYFLSKLARAEVRNYGKCGYRSSRFLEYYNSGNVDVTGSDIIIVMLGTNGGQDPDNGMAPENVAYATLIERLKSDAPGACLFVCTPPHVTENKEYSNFGYADQVASAVAFVREFALQTNTSLIDVASCPDFNAGNESIMQANDGLHFVEEGYRVLAQFMYDKLKDACPDLFDSLA